MIALVVSFLEEEAVILNLQRIEKVGATLHFH